MRVFIKYQQFKFNKYYFSEKYTIIFKAKIEVN